MRIGFTTISDCSVTGDGWFLDDVTVSSCEVDLALIFNDGFESGTLSVWSAFTP